MSRSGADAIQRAIADLHSLWPGTRRKAFERLRDGDEPALQALLAALPLGGSLRYRYETVSLLTRPGDARVAMPSTLALEDRGHPIRPNVATASSNSGG